MLSCLKPHAVCAERDRNKRAVFVPGALNKRTCADELNPPSSRVLVGTGRDGISRPVPSSPGFSNDRL